MLNFIDFSGSLVCCRWSCRYPYGLVWSWWDLFLTYFVALAWDLPTCICPWIPPDMRLDTLMFFYFIPWLSFPRFLLFWLLYLWSFLWMKAYTQRLFLVFDKTDWATHGFRWSRDVNEMYALFFRIFCSFFNIRKQRSLHAKSSSSKTGSVLGLRLNKSDKCKNSGGRDWSLPSSCCRLCIGEENRAAAGSRGNRELEKERLYGESFRGEPKKKKQREPRSFSEGREPFFFSHWAAIFLSPGCWFLFITGLLFFFITGLLTFLYHRAAHPP